MQANAAKADGQRALWKLRGNWRVLSVLRVLREQQRAMCMQIQQRFKGLKPGKRQERARCRRTQQRLTARGLGGSCREGIGSF